MITPTHAKREFIEPGIVTAALWLALVTGLLEAAIHTVRKFGFGEIIWLSEHYAWMAPVGYVIVLLPIALIVAGLAARLPGLIRYERAVGLIVFLCATGVLYLVPRVHRVALIFLAAGIAVQAARILRVRANGFRRLTARSLPWLGAIVVAIAIVITSAQWSKERRAVAALKRAPVHAQNVILIILDTVRAASMSLYGYMRPTTPQLERLAQRGTVFDRAFSPSPWTLPAHGAIFTGAYPHEQTSDWETPLDERDPTLAEVLGAHGYATAGFSANPFYGMWEHGLDRGFVHYEGYPVSIGQVLNSSSLASVIFAGLPGKSQNIFRHLIGNYEFLGRRRADDITSAFLSWHEKNHDRPFFAFLNYMDAHQPYVPPKRYQRTFNVHDPRTAWQRVTGRVPGMTRKQQRQFSYDANAYDATIAFIDAELGRLFHILAQRGVLENSLVIIASDHGEHLGEHGLYGHANSLYTNVLHVPLLIMSPGKVPEGRRVHEFVSTRSIPATVLDLTGVARGRLPGKSLAEIWKTPTVETDALLSELRKGINAEPTAPNARSALHGLISDSLYLIRTTDGSETLFDLKSDMAQNHNLAADTAVAGKLNSLRNQLQLLLGAGSRHVVRSE